VVGALGDVILVVRRADVAEIFPLRHAVLRPGRSATDSVYAGDDTAIHIGAWDGDALVGCATTFADPWAGSPPDDTGEWTVVPAAPTAWRLRGMAVEPGRQGQGIGAQVLAEIVRTARDQGAPLLWANARSAALSFYLRAGWIVAGPEFLTKDTGLPHRAMTVGLAP